MQVQLGNRRLQRRAVSADDRLGLGRGQAFRHLDNQCHLIRLRLRRRRREAGGT